MSQSSLDGIKRDIQGTTFIEDSVDRYWKIASWLILLAITIGIFIAPQYSRRYILVLISQWAIFTIAVQGLNLTLGYAGQISLAQAAFLGVGAYTSALFVNELGMNYWLSMLMAGVVSFIIGAIVGFPALRVKGHFLAFVTLGFNGLVVLFLRNEEWLTNGVYGIIVERPDFFNISLFSDKNFAYFSLIMLVIVTVCVWYMLRSPWGRAFQALRDNPTRAESLGISITTYTLLAFAIGSGIAGIAGAMISTQTEFIEPNMFALPRSLLFLLMVMVGGRGSLLGPFIGTAFVVLLPEYLRFTEEYYLIIFAVAVMLLMIFFPQGVAGFLPAIRKRLVQRQRKNS